MSPSSRRAWIEIPENGFWCFKLDPSPSSRRAWIEIFGKDRITLSVGVALLAEGVDRNS